MGFGESFWRLLTWPIGLSIPYIKPCICKPAELQESIQTVMDMDLVIHLAISAMQGRVLQPGSRRHCSSCVSSFAVNNSKITELLMNLIKDSRDDFRALARVCPLHHDSLPVSI